MARDLYEVLVTSDGQIMAAKSVNGNYVTPDEFCEWFDHGTVPEGLLLSSEACQARHAQWLSQCKEDPGRHAGMVALMRRIGMHPNWGLKEFLRFVIMRMRIDPERELGALLDLSEHFTAEQLEQIKDTSVVSPMPSG